MGNLSNIKPNPNDFKSNIDEIIKQFTDFDKKYYQNPLFHNIVNILVRGGDPYNIINDLIDMNINLMEDYKTAIENHHRKIIIPNHHENR